MREAHELGDFLADAAVDDHQRVRLAGFPALGALEPAVQHVAFGRDEAHFLDAARARQRLLVALVDGARAEHELRLERLEQRRDAARGDERGRGERDGY